MKVLDEEEAGLAPIARSGSLGERGYESLKGSIIRGEFPVETKLTVRSVAEALAVSTTPARDAINRLIGEGALVNLGPKTVVVPQLTMPALDEITKIRLALEGLAAEEAAPHLGEADHDFLAETQEQLNRALAEGRYREVLRLNKAFHFLIYERSRMPRLVAMIESQWLRIGPSLNNLYPEFAITRQGVSNHQWALQGIRERDPRTLRAAMENDLRDGYRRLADFVRSRGS